MEKGNALIVLSPQPDDAPEFIARAKAVINGMVRRYEPPALILVKINNWFDVKWLRFSGKMLGAVPFHKYQLTLPPFVPNRVVLQRRFVAPLFQETDPGPSVHKKISSSNALTRWMADVPGAPAIAWYSGKSEDTGHGAVMVYAPVLGRYVAWYAAWAREAAWQVKQARNIRRQELDELIWGSFTQPLAMET